MKKRGTVLASLCAGALALVLLLALALPGADAANEDIIFVAINEQVLALTADTMPVTVKGTVYVPYTVFESSYSKVDLGIAVAYVPDRVTFFNLRKRLTYHVDTQTTTNENDEEMDYKAIVRNGKIYVPVIFTARYFDLETSSIASNYGTVIRIKNGAVELSDKKFMEAAEVVTLASRLDKYYKNLNPVETPRPVPVPTPSPAPTPIPSPGVTPSTPPEKNGVRVYLAFQHQPGGDPETVLDALDRGGVYGLFFFAPEDLFANADAVRRIAATGHGIGLLVSGTDPAALTQQLEQGEALLEGIAQVRTRIVLASGGRSAVSALTGDSWLCWQRNVDGLPTDRMGQTALANEVFQALEVRSTPGKVLLDDSAVSAGALGQLLPRLRQGNYSVRLAVETEL